MIFGLKRHTFMAIWSYLHLSGHFQLRSKVSLENSTSDLQTDKNDTPMGYLNIPCSVLTLIGGLVYLTGSYQEVLLKDIPECRIKIKFLKLLLVINKHTWLIFVSAITKECSAVKPQSTSDSELRTNILGSMKSLTFSWKFLGLISFCEPAKAWRL